MIHKNCRYYIGSRPCVFHKSENYLCADCPQLEPISCKILIIKLGAMGDVVRTTAILHQLKKQGTQITWVTHADAQTLIPRKYVDRVVVSPSEALFVMLTHETFDVVYGLDNDYVGAGLASLAKAKKRFGYGLTEAGEVTGVTPASEAWLEISVNDNLKKANRKTYQDVLFSLCGISFSAESDAILLPDGWESLNLPFLKNATELTGKIFGLVLGAGKRWPYKAISIKKWRELINFAKGKGHTLLLIGGPEESTLMAELKKEFGQAVIETGTDNTSLQLIKILSLCDVVICGDTLSMHLAMGLRKTVFAYVGPTSVSELERYGTMIPLLPEVTWSCCYKTACDERKLCNESFSWETVFQYFS